jgi:hypothetical protein
MLAAEAALPITAALLALAERVVAAMREQEPAELVVITVRLELSIPAAAAVLEVMDLRRQAVRAAQAAPAS